MQTVGLVQKLVAANVVEKRLDRLDFTFSFDSYLSWHAARNNLGAGSLEDWAEMLMEYDHSLGSLSPEEVATFIVLLEYSSERADNSPIPK